jgi:hypothetical protein
MNNNRGLLIVIIVLLAGIAGLMFMNHQRQEQTIGGQINEVIEEIGDEIDDATR